MSDEDTRYDVCQVGRDRAPKESKHHTGVKDAFASLGADMKALAIVWNPARDVSVLKEHLACAEAKFLLPLSADAELPKLIHQGKSLQTLFRDLQSAVSHSEYRRAPSARLLVCLLLSWHCRHGLILANSLNYSMK
jgi:hypothetical protein